MCWHCQSEVAGEYFCDRCVKVQPVSKELDYFTCLGFPRRLTIDQHQLEAKFYELSRAFHPDFYQNKSAAEQTISLGNSAMLNTAYRTLRDPIERAEYLLDLEAGPVARQKPSRRSARNSNRNGTRSNNGNGTWKPPCSSFLFSGTHSKIAGRRPTRREPSATVP
jgi:DnaJ-class molecular chaperone